MDASSSVRFAHNQLILQNLGQYVATKQDLLNLCHVNKLFNHEFSAWLYRDLCFRLRTDDGTALHPDPSNRHLVHTRRIIIPPASSWPETSQVETLDKIIQHTPGLQTLEWHGSGMRGFWHSWIIELLQKSCPRLKGVHIHHRGILWAHELTHAKRQSLPVRVEYCPMAQFRNLQYLTLDSMDHHLDGWMRAVVKILLASPQLRGLALSIDAWIVHWCVNNDKIEQIDEFFDRLCDSYAARGGQPLRLKALICGQCVIPTRHSSLVKMVQLEHLQQVHIQNKQVRAPWEWVPSLPIYIGESHPGITFASFGPEHCPNLGRLTVAQYTMPDFDDLMCEWAKVPELSKKLSVSWGTSGIKSNLPSYLPSSKLLWPASRNSPSRLPIKLRAMDIVLTQMDILDTVYDEETGHFHHFSVYSPEEILGDLAASNADSPEGLTVLIETSCAYIQPEFRSMNDGICPHCHFGKRMLDWRPLLTLKRTLPRLLRLRELSVTVPHIPAEETDTVELALAAMFGFANPGLRYVNINLHCWRVCRSADGDVKLEKLKWEERERVKILSHGASINWCNRNWQQNNVWPGAIKE